MRFLFNGEGLKSIMRLFRFKLIFILLSLFCLPSVQADSLILNGSAVYSHLTRDLYLGGLYLPTVSDDPDYITSAATAKRMQIIVSVSSWSPRRWSQIWQNNIAINNDSFDADANTQQALMTFTSFPREDIKAGDEIVIDYQPNGNSRVLLNGDLVLEVPGTAFFNYMVNTWIGKLPPTRDFRQRILGQEPINEDQKNSLVNHRLQRAGLFSGWVAAEKAAIKAEQVRIAEARAAAAAEKKQLQRSAEAARQAELQRQQQLKAQQSTQSQQAEQAKAERLAKQRAEQQRKEQEQAIAAQAKKLQSQGKKNSSKALAEEQRYYLSMLQWQLQRQTQASVTYPAWAKQFGQEGLVELDFRVNRAKEVSNMQARNDGASDLLVNEVKRAVTAAALQASIPADLAGDDWPVSVSYLFSLKGAAQAELTMPKTPASLQKSKASTNSKELEANYISTELERIAENVKYPPGARILKKSGKVIVEFDVSKDGKVLAIRDKESSRHRELNQAIHAAVKGSEPYPPLPIGVKKEQLTLTLDYDFKL